MGEHERLRREIWDTNRRYYESAGKGSAGALENAGLARIAWWLRGCESVLDCGCGEGTKGELVIDPESEWIGLDCALQGLTMAGERGSRMIPEQGDMTAMPFPSCRFDAVFSAFVFEHMESPDSALAECIRVTKTGGLLALIAPNFGSPLFPSPCSREDYRARFFRRLRWAAKRHTGSSLEWEHVVPRALDEEWQSDYDTLVEPFLPTLRHVLRICGCDVLECSTRISWAKEHRAFSLGGLAREMARIGCALRLPYVRDWGPNFYVIARKNR